MASASHLDRRTLLVGGGAGVGLVVAWALWPRRYPGNLTANPGETLFGAWLKIGDDGRVTVAVPQVEHGQGVYTALPQIVADALGADWRTVGVEAAPLNPLYANPLGAHDLWEGTPDPLGHRAALTITAASSSVRQWEDACQRAGAAARALLQKAAARRWGVAWDTLAVDAGFVVGGRQRLRFADLAADAARERLPDPLPVAGTGTGNLAGRALPRLDVPAKVDGSANFAGDIRLADLVHARIRQGPPGDTRLVRADRAAADRVRGCIAVIENPRWVAAVATTGWAAHQALDAVAPRFATRGGGGDSATIDAALDRALAADGVKMAHAGDVDAALTGGQVVTQRYRAAAAVHAAIETPSAVASFRDGRLEMWLATQAPGLARAAAAHAANLAEEAVIVHPMLVGGSFGAALEMEVARQAAVLAVELRRPVNLVWSRGEDLRHLPPRAPAAALMQARLAPGGAILGWRARIAAPSTGAELARRMMPGIATETALRVTRGDAYAVAGAAPPYRLPAFAVEHHPVALPFPTGHLRGGAHGYTCFFTECFLDELAHLAGSEPVSYRIGMLGGDARLARCLSTAASLGGWEGGIAGSGQGIACHAFRGSYVAVLAEAHAGDNGRPVVDRLVAAIDCGRQINPGLVRQQAEGALVFGLAAALGADTGVSEGMPAARGFSDVWLPRLADTPDITVELIASDEAPGGVSELCVPPVAPAIANALAAATGARLRSLPLRTHA